MPSMWDPKRIAALCLAIALPVVPSRASDHGDTPLMDTLERQDAKLTDLHVFRNGENLVLALSTNPMILPGVSDYRFPSDLTLRFHIDNHSAVSFAVPDDVERLGGTIVRPEGVGEDIIIEVRFRPKTGPLLRLIGLPGKYKKDVRLFAGLRDDPFIRVPRLGRNVAAVVVEIPIEAVAGSQPTLLVWGTSEIPELRGQVAEHAGRAFRSMFSSDMNHMPPREHWMRMGLMPDVVILDLTSPDGFPNGRGLEDDVIALLAEELPPALIRSEGDDRPTTNDVPFLDEFPYLAPPHRP